jgi:hypothetical protein
LSSALFSWEISSKEAENIGHQIFINECSGKVEKLVWWNDGENFASLGIGHFIWYPKEEKGPFEETFPLFLAFLNARNVCIPVWLQRADKNCPWNSKQEFLEKNQEAKKKDLQAFLSRTIPLQIAFIITRFEQTIPRLFSDLPEKEKKDALRKIESIGQTLQGKYALVDYLNFKGEGTSQKERYCGQGWGFRQVIQEMPGNAKDPVIAFAETAKMVLKRRVQNAPIERREERWLSGWLARVDSYKNQLPTRNREEKALFCL